MPVAAGPSRAAVPGTGHGGPTGAWDVALAAVVGVLWFGSVELLSRTDYWRPTWPATYWMCGVALVITVAARRRRPRVMFVAAVLVYPLLYRVGLQSEIHLLPVVLAAFAVTRSGAVRPVAAGAVAVGATLALLTQGGPALVSDLTVVPVGPRFVASPSYASALVGTVVMAVALAAVVRRLERAVADLAERNAQMQALEAERMHRAVLDERTRIARELHDVVAHHMTAIVVRANAANHVAASDPAAPLEATRWIAEAGTEAMQSLRGVVAVLRSPQADPLHDRLAPTSGAAELVGAVDRVRRAGLQVALTLPPRWPQYPPVVVLAAARVVQESLTNVLRHSAAGVARVVLRDQATALWVEVCDPGPARAVPVGSGGGNGLLTMSERARACSGRLVAGPHDGGWRVLAQLPVTAPVADGGAS